MMLSRFATVLLLGTLLLPSSFAFADEAVSADPATERPNAVSFELLGRGLFYSIDYDRAITDQISVGGGFSNWSVSATNDDGTEYSATSVTIIPLYLDYYFYNAGSNRWFATGGVDIVTASFHNSDLTFSGSGAALTAGIGYEYRAQNGFLFRADAYLFIGGGSGIVWPGLTFGYTF